LVDSTNSQTERQLSDMNPTSHVTQSPVIHSGLNPAAQRENVEASSEQSRLPPSTE
jgi:hypothetical protein